jgi:hypothetical protein
MIFNHAGNTNTNAECWYKLIYNCKNIHQTGGNTWYIR